MMKFYFKKSVLLSALVVLSCVAAFAQNTGGIKGKVRSPRGGTNAADTVVTARQKGEDIKSTKTDANGEFLLEGLESGLYTLVFNKEGFGSGMLYNVEVKKKKINDLGDRLTLRIDQGTQVIVKGSVFNQDGVSLPNAKVQIERIDSSGASRKVGSDYTTQEGEFTFRFAEGASKFRITAEFKGISASKEVSVEEAAIYRTAITLNIPKKD